MKTGFVTFKAKDGQVAQLLEETLLEMKAISKNEAGLVNYEIFQSEENVLTYYVRESWTDQTTFEVHLAQPHIQKFLVDAPQWLTEPISSIALNKLG